MALFLSGWFLLAGVVGPKPFEGVITYTVEVKPKVQVAGRANAWKNWGDTLRLYIKGADWKETYSSNGKVVREVFYSREEHKRYTRRASMGGLEIEDVSKETNILQSSKTAANVSFVMGKQCKVFLFEATSDKDLKELKKTNPAAKGKAYYRYAYPDHFDYVIDNEMALGHKKNFLEAFYKGTHLPFLSYEFEDDEVIITYTALSVEPQKLNEGIFEIPK